MIKFLSCDPEAILRWFPLLMLLAIASLVLSFQFGGLGILSSVHLFIFAVSAASMQEYKTEKGLWMLALTFAVLWAGMMSLCIYGQFMDLIRGVRFNPLIAVDAATMMFIMRMTIRFLWKCAKINYTFRIHRHDV